MVSRVAKATVPPAVLELSAHRPLSVDELSNYLGVPAQTIYVWRTKGRGPRAIRVGKFIRFRPEDVATWLEDQADAQ